ncbi:MAG: DNA polymerase/3'-5' exonuclease PolX [Polyangiaceae bacterium]|nr:DNA polymerase/3'-5' exonuclease PolX [Polyangiaceae bacterium]MBK8938527.1 DNA polymerase/3'-5' exonuclease PolX [Polyangiaceae bacterium]
MRVDKADVADMLRELAELTIVEEGDPQSFRVRAYESARHAVEAYGGELVDLSAAALQKVPGIGKSTAAKIRELVEQGRVAKLDELREKHPPGVLALLRLPGVGPKAVARLRAELGVHGPDELRAAIARHALRDLKGFGPKSEEKLARALERLGGEGERRTPISVALPLAVRICARLSAVPGVERAAYCGSLRRFSETVGDLDIVAATEDGAPVMQEALSMPIVDRVLSRGDTRASFVTRAGLQVDLRVVAPHQIGAAMLYFTGSKGHNIKLRQRAIDRGWTLNEYALADAATGDVVASRSEADIYEALGLSFIHPAQREDAGEIELAEKGNLPRVVSSESLIGDFHVHTSLSGDARSSLEEIVSAARARGYRVLAITDHAEGLPANGVGADALRAQRDQIRALQRELGDAMTLLWGVELNIGPHGELDYDAELRSELDFGLASIHDHFDLDEARQTARVVKAMEDPAVKMIGHLSARMIGARPPVPLDVPAVLAAAERTGTALEINGGLPRLDVSVDVLRRARDRGVRFVLTSDAHKDVELGRIEYAALNATRAWVDPDRIVNTWERSRLEAWARSKSAP